LSLQQELFSLKNDIRNLYRNDVNVAGMLQKLINKESIHEPELYECNSNRSGEGQPRDESEEGDSASAGGD